MLMGALEETLLWLLTDLWLADLTLDFWPLSAFWLLAAEWLLAALCDFKLLPWLDLTALWLLAALWLFTEACFLPLAETLWLLAFFLAGLLGREELVDGAAP